MTRINLVPPGTLVGKHLVAEYVELPRVFGKVRDLQSRPEHEQQAILRHQPPTFVMGRGHMRFFYTRLGWLRRRQESLIEEMLRRGYRPSYITADELCEGIEERWFGEWEPSQAEIDISRARIAERLRSMAV